MLRLSTLRRDERMVIETETPAQSGRAFNPNSNAIRPEPIRASVALAARHLARRGVTMEMPAILRGDSLTRLLQGAAAGAVATLATSGGAAGQSAVTGGSAKDMVQRSTTSAVVSALSPICVDKFQHSAGAAANMVELKKVSSYQQGPFIEKGGWATLPGNDSANSAVARACAEMLSNLK